MPQTVIKNDRQQFVDEPVFARPKRRTTIDLSVAAVFGSQQNTPIVLGYERVRLRWMKPDGKGGLTPR